MGSFALSQQTTSFIPSAERVTNESILPSYKPNTPPVGKSDTPYQTCAKLAQQCYKSGLAISKGLVTPSSKQKYESLSPVDVVVFSLPSKDIS